LKFLDSWKGIVRGKKELLGVDIGTSAIKLAEIAKKGESYILKQAHIVPITPGRVSSGAIIDLDGLASELNTIWNSLGLKTKNVAIALPGNMTILRRARLPYVPEEEIESAIKWEIEKTLPFKVEDIHFDYFVYEIKENESIDLIYAVAKREVIKSFQDLAQKAGLELSVLDSAYLSLANITMINYDDLEHMLFLIFDIGAESSNLLVLKNNRIVYGRNVEVGGTTVTSHIAKATGCDVEEAEQAKLKGEVEEGILREGAHELALKLYNEAIISLNFAHNLLGTKEDVEKIFITGGSSNTPFLITEISSLMNTEVHNLLPIRKIDLHPNLDPSYIDEIAPRMCTAMGTALRAI